MRRVLGLALLLAGGFWFYTIRHSGATYGWAPTLLVPGHAPALAEAAPQTEYTPEEARDIAIYKRVSPSVVNITSQTISYDLLFGAVPESGQGSGFFIDKDGDILTNYHVIQGARTLKVNWTPARNQSHTYSATVVGAVASLDLAVIRIHGGDFPPAVLGDSSNLQVGQKVLAIGNPFGLPGTMTKGIISSIRTVQEGDNRVDIENALQTDAPINPGNSGGPLLNSSGDVIGIDTMIYSETGSNVGIGFAIPIAVAKAVLDPLLKTGHVVPVQLGIRSLPISPDIAAQLGLAVDHGVLVLEVQSDGLAARAGLRAGTQPGYYGSTPVRFGGDIIVALNGEPVQDATQIANLLLLQKPGTRVVMSVIRDGRSLDLTLPLP